MRLLKSHFFVVPQIGGGGLEPPSLPPAYNDGLCSRLKNLSSLSKESTVEPKESTEFKFYQDGSAAAIVDFDHPSVTMGLKGALQQMKSQGKIDYLTVPKTEHIAHNPEWFTQNIITTYLKD